MPDRVGRTNTTWPDLVDTAVFHAQFAIAGKDVLCFLRGVGVPAESTARLDLIDDGRGLSGSVPSVCGKRAVPTY